MAGESKKITIYIFLFAIFIMLAMVLGTRIYNIYTGSRAESEKTIESTMRCTFSFTVSNLEYDGSTLRFDLKTSDREMLKKLVVEPEGVGGREIDLGIFIGFKQRVSVENMMITDAFYVYPSGCGETNRKMCTLSASTCKNVK